MIIFLLLNFSIFFFSCHSICKIYHISFRHIHVPSKHAYLCNRVPQDGWKNNGSLWIISEPLFLVDAVWPCAFNFLICLSFLLTSSQQVFVCVPRCTEQSDKKKIIPYGFQTPYSLCTGLHRFGTLITSLIIVPLHNQFIPVEKI